MPEPLSDDQLVNICNQECDRAINGLDDDSPEISEAIDYYLGRLPGITNVEQKDPRSSDIVSMDVQDGIEATLAEIMPTFTNDEVAYFEPEGPDDERQVREESELINYLLMKQYNGYTILYTAIKDALLNKNGVVKVYWDKRQSVSYVSLDNISEDLLPALLQPEDENEIIEVIERGEETDTFSLKLRRTRIEETPVIEGVPPEEVLVCGDHTEPSLSNIRFVAHEKLETESSLIEQGFDPDIVERLPEYSISIENIARSRRSEEVDYNSQHHSTRLIKVRECYPLIDKDGDGIAERRKVVIAGNTLLSDEEWDQVNLVGGTAIIMPHKYLGISLFERLRDIQRAKTPLIRSIIDGGKLAANPRTGVVTGQVNIDDLLMSRTGGTVRADSRDSVFDLPKAEVPPSVFSTVSFLDQLRRERGGSAVDSASQAQQVAGDTAHGIERTMSVVEQNNALLAMTLGETLVRGIFLALHGLLRKHQKTPLQAKIGGKWVYSDPSKWPQRSRVSVNIGSSTAERQRQVVVMSKVIDMHRELHEMKAPLVDLERSYRAITDLVRMAGIKSPERYFIDPESPEGQKKIAQMNQELEIREQERKQVELAMVQAQHKIAQAEMNKAEVQHQNGMLKAENDRLSEMLKAIKTDADTVLKAKKQSDDFALGVGKLEIEASKDMSAQIEANR